MKKLTFDIFHDTGHGWLKVLVSSIKELGLCEKISQYSRISPDRKFAFLEEDRDAPLFINTYNQALPSCQGFHLYFRHHYSERLSRIRGYPRWDMRKTP